MNALPDAADTARVKQQAARWLVSLGVSDPGERARAQAGFAAWKAQDPSHSAMAQRMEALLANLPPLSSDAARAARTALKAGERAAATQRRRRTGRIAAGLASLAFGAAALWLGERAEFAQAMLADLRTAPGEWRSEQLPDGSRLVLAGGSAVDIRFDGERRTVRLIRGDLLVEVAKDAHRPFAVRTRDGEVQALGTQFVVERKSDATHLAMLESTTAVRSASQLAPRSAQALVVRAGEQVRITQDAVTPLAPIDTQALGNQWQTKQWVVLDRPLAEVLDELARHRNGHVGYDAAALAGLRVSAVLPLDNTDQALDLLRASFPGLRVRQLSSWWVQVDRPG